MARLRKHDSSDSYVVSETQCHAYVDWGRRTSRRRLSIVASIPDLSGSPDCLPSGIPDLSGSPDCLPSGKIVYQKAIVQFLENVVCMI
jgi:hypothetical protein